MPIRPICLSAWRQVALAAASILLFSTPAVHAQAAAGAIAGRVVDSTGKGVDDALVHVLGTKLGAKTDDDGTFKVDEVPAGAHRVVVTSVLGFAPDTFAVTVAAGQTVNQEVRLRFTGANTAKLGPVIVTAARMGETVAAALDQQQKATNIINVMSGDEIRALPNYNAAEAAGRISGVSLERDEGEGKYVQVRGTEPRLTNVTIDGANVPGTLPGERVAKLDDVPSDILGAIKVSKTLTADMSADAIGGSVDLVTKTPGDEAQGYVSGQYGDIDLLGRSSGQVGLTYGGRFGDQKAWGFLLGGSWDRTGRAINDLEPAWGDNTAGGGSHPVEWSQRDYVYNRTRIGLGGDIDYRFDPQNTIYVKGMYSHFQNFGTRYVYDLSSSGDSAASGTTGYGTGVTATREVSNRTPTEQLYGGTAGGVSQWTNWALNYQVNYAGTSQKDNDYRATDFIIPTPLTIQYNYASRFTPTYVIPNASQAAASVDPTQYAMTGYNTDFDQTTARDLGGNVDLLRTYNWSGRESEFKFGFRVRDENKDFAQDQLSFNANNPYTLATGLSAFSDPKYYTRISSAYPLGPVPDFGVTSSYENANPGAFTSTTDTLGNMLASFTGHEQILAGYVMNNTNFGPMLVNLGLRVEQTHVNYTANAVVQDTLGNSSVTPVAGSTTYIDWFPSLMLKYSTDGNSNFRLAVTRGIARPNYSDIAPSLSGIADPLQINNFNNVSAGNPDLKAQTAWNYDLLVEHFFKNVGVLSGGVFYKQISNFIFSRTFRYAGPYAPLVGYAGTQPQNGNSGHVQGIELEWIQYFNFLSGFLSGFAIDANYTHTNSSAKVPCGTVGVGGCAVSGTDTTRNAALNRQSPDLANVALIYDKGQISARIAWTYNSANVFSYGDGSNSGASGDTYLFSHSQFDASLMWNVSKAVQLQFQALNLNNAIFGFYTGTPSDHYNIQREYYGSTYFFGVRYGFVGY